MIEGLAGVAVMAPNVAGVEADVNGVVGDHR